MKKLCGNCESFVPMGNMFGGCGAGMREKFDHETFSSNPGCKKFEPAISELKEEIDNQFMQTLVEKLGGSGVVFMGEGLPPGMLPGEQPKKKDREGWINPLIKNPKPRKNADVIHLATWKSSKGKG